MQYVIEASEGQTQESSQASQGIKKVEDALRKFVNYGKILRENGKKMDDGFLA